MKVFALFEDKTAGKVLISTYLSDKPIDADVINQNNLSVKASATKGASAAYGILMEKDLLDKENREDRYFLSFEFAGERLNFNVLGESAGLAFSLKFYDEVYKRKKRKEIPFSVAATGRISDHTEDAKVGRVEGINEKLAAAANILKEGDRLLYPKENEKEIDEKVKEELKAKGIKSFPVSTVKEAIEEVTIFDWGKDLPPQPSPAKHLSAKRMILAFLFLVLGALASIGYFGYKEVKERVREISPEKPSEKPGEVKQPLDFRELNFHYFTAHPGKVDLKGNVSHLDVALSSGDGYQLEIEPEDDCYLYIYQLDSTGNLACLFPKPEDIRARNPLKAGATYWLPSKEEWYYLDENVGEENIYLLASHGHLEVFGDNLEIIEKIKSQNVEGSFYREFRFGHK